MQLNEVVTFILFLPWVAKNLQTPVLKPFTIIHSVVGMT